jgi:hypothetical protein
MAAFPGILQSPFVVATDSPVQALGTGSLLAIDAAVERREARGKRPSKPKKPTPAIPDAVDRWPQLTCMQKKVSEEDRAACEASCKAQGRPCAWGCSWKWQEGECWLVSDCASEASECGLIDEPVTKIGSPL